MASSFVRSLKTHYDDCLGNSLKDISDEHYDAMTFETIYSNQIIIMRFETKGKDSYVVSIDGKEYGKENYLLDRFLIRKISTLLKNEILNITAI